MTHDDAIRLLNRVGYARDGAVIRHNGIAVGTVHCVRPRTGAMFFEAVPRAVERMRTPHPTREQAIAWLMLVTCPELWAHVTVRDDDV